VNEGLPGSTFPNENSDLEGILLVRRKSGFSLPVTTVLSCLNALVVKFNPFHAPVVRSCLTQQLDHATNLAVSSKPSGRRLRKPERQKYYDETAEYSVCDGCLISTGWARITAGNKHFVRNRHSGQVPSN